MLATLLAALELHGRARKSGDSRRGRPPLPALVKRVNGLGRVVAQVEDLSLSAEGIASYGAQRCREMRDALEEHLATLEDLRDTVDHALELAEHEPGGGTQRSHCQTACVDRNDEIHSEPNEEQIDPYLPP